MYPKFKLSNNDGDAVGVASNTATKSLETRKTPFSTIVQGNIQDVDREDAEMIMPAVDAATQDSDYIIIKADPGNSGTIYIGSSTVTSNDFALAAGNTIEFYLKNLTQIYVLASTGSQNIQFIYFRH